MKRMPSATKTEGQLKEQSLALAGLMDHDAGAGLLNPYAQTKVGSDTIFRMVGAIPERRSGREGCCERHDRGFARGRWQR